MTGTRRMADLAPVALLALLYACGGDGTGDPDAGPELAFPDQGPGDTAGGDGGAKDPGTAPGVHPHWGGVAWDDFRPTTSEVATYRFHTGDQRDPEVEARTMDGFAAPGGDGAWTRVAFGPPPAYPGEKDALLVYLDWKTPWLLKVKGVEVYQQGYVDGPAEVMVFETPLEIPLDTPAGQWTTVTARVRSNPADPGTALEGTFRMGVVSYDAPCGDDFPGLAGCARYQAKVSGPLVGEARTVDLVAHPQRGLLLWNTPPGFVSLTQLQGWQ